MENSENKIKNFFSRIWNGLTVAGRIIFGIIILGIIALGVYAATNKDDNKNDSEANQPEVAQTFEPSIGAPLPPDNSGGVSVNGQVGGATTTEPSTSTNATETAMTAPNTGIDPTKPIAYQNDSLKFAATLPAGSNVDESATEINFSSRAGNLLYSVSVNNADKQTISDIEAQLHNSPTARNISPTKFAGHDALKFTATDYGSGIAFMAYGKSYYLLGDSKYFESFKLTQ